MSGKELNELIQTGELAKGEIQAEQLKAAEEYAEEQLEEAKENAKEDRDRRRIALIKFGSMAVLAAAIVIFASIAWFTHNREVSAGSMAIKTAGPNFEIATSGTRIMFETMVSKADNIYSHGKEKSSGTVVKSDGTEEIISTYYVTDSSDNNQNLMLRFDGTEDDTKIELEPGGSGVFEFYVIPYKDGDLNVEIELSVRGFVQKDITVEGVKQTVLHDISKLSTSMGYTTSDISDKQEALRYLEGHVFFFEETGEPDDATSPYYYKKPIVNGVYSKTFSDAEAGKLYPITIYWMWPKTLGQITLKNNSSSKRSGIPVVEDGEYSDGNGRTDKGKLIDIIKVKHNSLSFFDSTETITTAMIENSADSTNFKILSKGYNNADEMIGTHVRYVLLEVGVK